MPKLSCRTCGRQVYTVAPVEALFLEERRCPRCGAYLYADRREVERRVGHRRINPPNDPGPPRPEAEPSSAKTGRTAKTGKGAKTAPTAKTAKSAATAKTAKSATTAKTVDEPKTGERRVVARRTLRRRGGGPAPAG